MPAELAPRHQKQGVAVEVQSREVVEIFMDDFA